MQYFETWFSIYPQENNGFKLVAVLKGEAKYQDCSTSIVHQGRSCLKNHKTNDICSEYQENSHEKGFIFQLLSAHSYVKSRFWLQKNLISCLVFKAREGLLRFTQKTAGNYENKHHTGKKMFISARKSTNDLAFKR